MDFLAKLDYLMEKNKLNKHAFSQASGIPYTTIDGFYKKGYEKAKLSTLRKIASFFQVSLDYIVDDSITDPQYGNAIDVGDVTPAEHDHIKKYRALDANAQGAVDSILEYEYKLMMRRREEDEWNVIHVPFQISDQPASAGLGIYLGPESFTTRYVRKDALPHGAAFGVPVRGDSMVPFYDDGDIVIVSREPVEEEQVGVFTIDGEGFIKKLGMRGALLSLNPKYPPITFRPERNMVCNGRVIGKLRPKDVQE